MPDLTMCNNDECPKAKECYRHEVKPSPHGQARVKFKNNRLGCSAFVEMTAKGEPRK